MPPRTRIHAVILAGGAGERFWPASRRSHPKPLLRVLGDHSLLEATALRARRFADEVWLVCGSEHAAPMRRELGLPAARVLVEPSRRNTAMAVGLAATRIAAEDPEAVIAVLPADHHISDSRAFSRDMRRAARAARDARVLVTLGVSPTRPDTGYGYIRSGGAAGPRYPGLRKVRRFVEKPDAARARRYLRSGDYLWNAGIFVWTATTILEEIRTHMPGLYRALAPLRAAGRRPTRDALARAYAQAPSAPIDTGVMEASQRVWTLPVEWRWSDVGTWQALAEEAGVRPGVSRELRGDLVHDERGGNLVWGEPGKPVALIGVEGLAVVDTGDALLVTRLEDSAALRDVVRALKRAGREEFT
ncbi:MAG: NTP transferase domain-containing protein [Myxococcales bacterium]|nr:NTP transferase domain-containing protein [Myxococcales bacterium]